MNKSEAIAHMISKVEEIERERLAAHLEELYDPVSFEELFQKINFAHLCYHEQSQVKNSDFLLRLVCAHFLAIHQFSLQAQYAVLRVLLRIMLLLPF